MRAITVITIAPCLYAGSVMFVRAGDIKRIEPILDHYRATGELKTSKNWSSRPLKPKLKEYQAKEAARKARAQQLQEKALRDAEARAKAEKESWEKEKAELLSSCK